MRIIAGTARGRTLRTPKGDRTTRPTADRVRQAVFDTLGQWMEGQTVLDLFAGTGALGLEALSRGARAAVFVDQDREAAALCRANAEALGFLDRVEVLQMPAQRALDHLSRDGRTFDLVFSDPPYGFTALVPTVEAVGARGLLALEGVLCAEHDRREMAPDVVGPLARIDQRSFGDTRVSLYRIA